MTAVSTPLSTGVDSHAFRRGLISGLLAGLFLAASIVAGTMAAGLLTVDQPMVQTHVTQADPVIAPRIQSAPVVESYTDMGLRQAPVVAPYTDFGLRNQPAVEPYTDFGQRNPAAAPIDVHNPFQKGPIRAY
ncbi:MAG TPA: hypothetical protein VMP67_09735 [Candidatus Limnocylindria bacterium]|nr:hypothetical protein [Candidatus Limnocylindria bacterium]